MVSCTITRKLFLLFKKREERETNFDIEIQKTNKLMKKELEWVRRSPKASEPQNQNLDYKVLKGLKRKKVN